MVRDSNREVLHQFALVIYIPNPFAAFLDRLSLELTPGSSPHAHVSVLPPRPLPTPWPQVLDEAQSITADFAPFEIEATTVRVFPATNFIYLDIGRGAAELHRMHDLLSRKTLAHAELFPYSPHVTLGQDIPAECVQAAVARAEKAWSAYRGPRSFRAENAIFVKNAAVNHWLDVATLSFDSVVAATE